MGGLAISFILILAGLFLTIYSLFIKTKAVFVFGLLLLYFSKMLFIWLLSQTPSAETSEERGFRIFSFILVAVILGLISLVIGYPVLRFYFR